MKKVVIIAGPNGAGKTTFAKEFLPNEAGLRVFINADLIAAGLSPLDPDAAAIRAGRIMLDEIDRHAVEGRSFAFETTLSGRSYLQRIDSLKAAGYVVELIFLSLNSSDQAIARVATRVAQGGHSIPPDVIRRRFDAGRNLLQSYRVHVDGWQWYDNGGDCPILLDQRSSSAVPLADQALLRAARRARETARRTHTPLVIVRDGVLVEEQVAM